MQRTKKLIACFFVFLLLTAIGGFSVYAMDKEAEKSETFEVDGFHHLNFHNPVLIQLLLHVLSNKQKVSHKQDLGTCVLFFLKGPHQLLQFSRFHPQFFISHYPESILQYLQYRTAELQIFSQ